jgi:predicted polyphosphate/ATP-dependent NAD kinase
MSQRRVGLLVNPVAGMGGRVGLKGTDGPETLRLAIELGARPEAIVRASRTLHVLGSLIPNIEILTVSGAMGEFAARHVDVLVTVVGPPARQTTGAQDTRRAVQDLVRAGVDLLLFAGGDGTARDVMSGLGNSGVPALGIPAGCKMHSAVFATSPDSAGRLVARLLQDTTIPIPVREAEVMDIDEGAFRNDRVSAQLHGYLLVPDDRRFVQAAKSGRGLTEEAAIDGIAQEFVSSMDPKCLYLVGGGSTTKRIVEYLGCAKTLLGVDAILGDEIVERDINEFQILQLVQGREFRIVVSVIGSQGYIFGRGNQQLSAEVLKFVPKDHIMVVATTEKLVSVAERRLLVDSGDPEVDARLSGFMVVHTGYGRRTVMRVGS